MMIEGTTFHSYMQSPTTNELVHDESAAVREQSLTRPGPFSPNLY